MADTPGHEQYTRNMATGASKSDAAIILVGARKGMSAQTRRPQLSCADPDLHTLYVLAADRRADVLSRMRRSRRPNGGWFFRINHRGGAFNSPEDIGQRAEMTFAARCHGPRSHRS